MRFSPDHDPTLFSLAEIAEIEKTWQYAAVALSHYRLHNVFTMEDDTDDNEEKEPPILTLSRHSRQMTPADLADRTDIAAEAARNDVRCLCWASPRLREDKHFVAMILKQYSAKQEQQDQQQLQQEYYGEDNSDDKDMISHSQHKTETPVVVPPPVSTISFSSHPTENVVTFPHSPKRFLFATATSTASTRRHRGVPKQLFSLPRTLRLPGRQ
jgi:hypothetical protein